MLLSVENINVSYGHALVLENVSVNIASGEMVFIVGRNGAGKTTLLKTVAGFLSPAAGAIRFEGSDVTASEVEEKAHQGIRYVFQDKRVFSKLTVRENIQLAAYAADVPLESAVDSIVKIYPAIERFLDSKAGGLSGGQRQILLLGRALIGEPRLLLIDEPTEGLAAGVIKDVFNVLEMTKGKVSMIIVEQNLSVVRELADRVYTMKEGSVLAEFKDTEDIREQANLEQYL